MGAGLQNGVYSVSVFPGISNTSTLAHTPALDKFFYNLRVDASH
jgi:hypothetical protein